MSLLDDQVRAADLDRWLASRLVDDAERRADLIALYAFFNELKAVPTRARQPVLAEMRYGWWAEHLDGAFSGEPRKGHPVLERLALAVSRRDLPRQPFDGLIDAWVQAAHGQPLEPAERERLELELATGVLGGAGGADLQPVARLLETGEGRGEANRALRRLPAAAFPAVAHAALIASSAPEPLRRLKLLWATLRGRI